MLKVGRSCLFSLLYLCTCRYHAVTKYMAASHRSLCNTFTHGLERGQLIGRLLFFFMKPNRSVSETSLSSSSASYLSWSRQQHVLFGLCIYQYFICATWQLFTSPLRIINQLHSSSLLCTAFKALICSVFWFYSLAKSLPMEVAWFSPVLCGLLDLVLDEYLPIYKLWNERVRERLK